MEVAFIAVWISLIAIVPAVVEMRAAMRGGRNDVDAVTWGLIFFLGAVATFVFLGAIVERLLPNALSDQIRDILLFVITPVITISLGRRLSHRHWKPEQSSSSSHATSGVAARGHGAPKNSKSHKSVAKRIAPTVDSYPQSETMSLNEAELIVNAYGKTLQFHAPTPGSIADAGKLPFSKERIKSALTTALRASTDSQQREVLKAGYIALADWQTGVGEQDVGINATDLDLNGDARAIAKSVLMQTERATKWQEMALKETSALMQELRSLKE